ncbi:MAG: PEP-CTERM sorting domain-containing protein [Sedimentisphaerales bacterium]|jgi:hypothetical protein
MKRSKLILIQMLAITLVQVFTVAAFAAGVWSGPGTTFQEWSFPNSDMQNVAPDAATKSNPYGDPSAWIGSRASYNSGTWALITDEMDFYIPNNPQPRVEKEMQIEVDWMAGSGQGWPHWPTQPLLSVYPLYADPSLVVFPDISILSQELITSAAPLYKTVSVAPLYKTVFSVTMEPNPVSEWVILKGDIVVDHIAISTICIPEPATLGLLIGGALMAIRRGRKIKD